MKISQDSSVLSSERVLSMTLLPSFYSILLSPFSMMELLLTLLAQLGHSYFWDSLPWQSAFFTVSLQATSSSTSDFCQLPPLRKLLSFSALGIWHTLLERPFTSQGSFHSSPQVLLWLTMLGTVSALKESTCQVLLSNS